MVPFPYKLWVLCLGCPPFTPMLQLNFRPSFPLVATIAFVLLSLLLLPTVGTAKDLDFYPAPDGFIPKDTAGQETKISVQVGYSGRYDYQGPVKTGVWYPVWVTLAALEYDLRGQISVQQEGNPLIANGEVEIPRGEARRFLTWYRFTDSGIMLTTEIRGADLGRETSELILRLHPPDAKHILVLAEETGAFISLNRTFSRHTPKDYPAELLNTVAVLEGEIDFLPTDPVGLEPVDAIVFDTPQIRDLSPSQWNTIQSWAKGGGRLIVGTGRYQPDIEASVLKDAFGISAGVGSPVELRSLLKIKAEAGRKRKPPLSALRCRLDGDWEDVILKVGLTPLIVGKTFGAGYVAFSAFDFRPEVVEGIRESFATETGTGIFWNRLISDTDPPDITEFANARAGPIAESLQRPFAAKLPTLRTVLMFLGVYVLIAVIVNRFVFSRLRKLAWGWASTIVLAVLFTISGFAGSQDRGSASEEPQIHEVSFLARSRGSKLVRGATVHTIYSPRQLNHVFKTPANLRLAPVTGPSFRNDAAQPHSDIYTQRAFPVRFGQENTIRSLFVYPGSSRNFISNYSTTAAGAIEIVQPPGSEIETDQLRGKIRNDTPWNFRRWWIRSGWRVWTGTGPIPHGTTIDLALSTNASSTNDAFLSDSIRAHFGTRKTEAASEADPSDSGDSARSFVEEFFWSQAGRERSKFSRGFQFFGEAQAAGGDAFSGLGFRNENPLLFYEQDLGSGAKRSQLERYAKSAHWRAYYFALQESAETSAKPLGEKLAGASFDALTELLIFRPGLQYLHLVPDNPIRIAKDVAATVRLDVRHFPDADRAFGHKSRAIEQFVVEGCPAQVYNFRTSEWEAADLGASGVRLAPLRDYAGGSAQSIVLALDASANSIRLIQQEKGLASQSDTISGAALRGRINADENFAPDLPEMLQAKNLRVEVETMEGENPQ